MRLFYKLLKRFSVEEKVSQLQAELDKQYRGEELNQVWLHDLPKPTFKQKYPNGLPLNMLKNLDYSKYGAILKQQQLLPPSYDRKPVGVDIKPSESGDHNVKLIFKSKTSASYRIISIRRYDVSMTVNRNHVYDYDPIMSREWENFCERIMWLCEKKYPLHIVNQIKLKDGELDL